MQSHATGASAPLPDHAHAPALHAGFWLRFVAYLIDGLILSPVFALLYLRVLFPRLESGDDTVRAPFMLGGFVVVWLATIIVPWLYCALCESSRWQATPGKLALSLRVTDDFGQRIGFGRASGRHFGKFVSGLIMDIGYMLAGWTPRKQALHDLMANCCVVRKAGLDAWQHDPVVPAVPASAGSGMPGWALALVVIGACCFLVVPVMAIIAAIAIPAYQSYLVQAQVDQGIQMALHPRALVAEYIGEHGELPVDNAAVGLPEPEAIQGRVVESVQVDGGKVVVTFGNKASPAISGEHVVLSPSGSAAMLDWRCSSPDIRSHYLPVRCRD